MDRILWMEMENFYTIRNAHDDCYPQCRWWDCSLKYLTRLTFGNTHSSAWNMPPMSKIIEWASSISKQKLENCSSLFEHFLQRFDWPRPGGSKDNTNLWNSLANFSSSRGPSYIEGLDYTILGRYPARIAH